MDFKPSHDLGLIKLVLEYIWALFAAPLIWCVRQINQIKENGLSIQRENMETYISRQEYYRDMSSLNNRLDRMVDSFDKASDRMDRIIERVDK